MMMPSMFHSIKPSFKSDFIDGILIHGFKQFLLGHGEKTFSGQDPTLGPVNLVGGHPFKN